MKKPILLFAALAMAAAQASAIETPAKQAFMADAHTGAVLLEKSADEQMHPSSMSKLMTLYVLFQKLKEGKVKLTDTFPVSEKAWKMQGSKTFVHVGDQVSVDVLLHGIIVQSGNDACIVVAEGISGSEEAFAAEMNRIAQEIGLAHSHFVNATGWPDDNHLTTARDLATLARRLIEDFPEYYPYFAVREYTYNRIKQPNRNLLLNRSVGVDGLKTGHTEQAGYGITLSAKQGDRRLILVMNGLESEKLRAEEGEKLLFYGFREFANRTLLKKGQPVGEADIWFGKQPAVPLVVQDDLVVTLPVAAFDKLAMSLKYEGPVAAPVARGAHIADLILRAPGQETRVIPLVAGEDVAKLSGFGRIWAALLYYLPFGK